MKPNPVTYSRFLEHVQKGEVTQAAITAQSGAVPVEARLRDGRAVQSLLPADYQQALTLMEQQHVNIEILPASQSVWNALPFTLLLIAWLVLFWYQKRQQRPV